MIPLNLSSNYESGSLSYFNLSTFFSLQGIAAKHRESEHTRSRTSLRIFKNVWMIAKSKLLTEL